MKQHGRHKHIAQWCREEKRRNCKAIKGKLVLHKTSKEVEERTESHRPDSFSNKAQA